MAPSTFQPNYDVLIIGSGIGGLTAGALLAKAGLKVAVLESASVPGGYLSGFRRKDFRFDTAIHWLNQYMPGGMVHQVFDILGNDYPRAQPQRHIRRYLGEGYDYLLTDNPDELKQQWQAEFPEDAEGIERFFKAAKRLGKSFAEFGHIFRSEESKGFFEKLRDKRKLLKFAMPFIPHLRHSGDKMTAGLNRYFKAPKLHKVFESDHEMLGCLVPIGWAYYKDYQSPPPGGGQVIAEWLIHVMRHFGGELHLKSRVTGVMVEEGSVQGIRLHHRQQDHELRAPYVIAACDAGLLYKSLLPAGSIPEKILRNLREAPVYASSVTISLALDCPPSALGFGEELVHLSAKVSPKEAEARLDPATAEISILAPSHRDPSLAPEGQGTLVLFMPAWMGFEDEWRTGGKDAQGQYQRGEAYKALKQEVADAIIDRVERELGTGIRSHILYCDVATPVTHHRYTGNADGTMMGTKPGRSNMQKKVARYHTPVKNLFIGGHWAELGGGVPIAVKAGANAGLLVLKSAKPELFSLLADYLDGKASAGEVMQSPLMGQYPEDWTQAPTPAQAAAMRKVGIPDTQSGAPEDD